MLEERENLSGSSRWGNGGAHSEMGEDSWWEWFGRQDQESEVT